jgi:hypothetical protein
VVDRSERRRPTSRPSVIFPTFGHWDQPFALGLFPGGFARTSDRLRFFASFALGRLLIGLPTLHLTKNALTLHLLFEDPERLIDVVVAN